ncbi:MULTISPECIES: lipoprotein-releasing ABC transporter permease subunit [unclassified Rhizobium]|uniref:lipoprotein-releasing ABC transporter permease subunit n=1 Tax=unclassified Rhizobium TaxID=2613769 RepID=UPI0037F7CD91
MSDAGSKKGARPFSAFERMIAWRYLRSRRKETVVSVISIISFIGIMLGVATLIIVMAVMNGFRAELLDRLLGINGHLVVQPIESGLDDYEEIAARFNGIAGVRYAIPMTEGQVLTTGRIGAGAGALVRGVRGEDITKLTLVSSNIRQGTLDSFNASKGAAIGKRMADRLGLSVGDSIQLVAPEGDVTPFGVTARQMSYPVVAIFEVGMSQYDSSIIYLPLGEAQRYFNSEGVVQSIEVFVDDPDAVDRLRPSVESVARRPVFLTDWRQRNQTLFSALQVQRNVMFVVLTLIVLVAALNIISGLFMLVKDKGPDIAILRTMGATSGAIMRIFFMAGAAIGGVGTAAGVVLGVIVSMNVEPIRQFFSWLSGITLFSPELYFLSQLPARMDIGEIISVVLMALALSFLATLLPAWRAARLDPVDALRYE